MTYTTAPVWTLGDRLAKARKTAGVEQTEMASFLGVSTGLISLWEHDKRTPRVGMLRLWAQKCDVPVTWLDDRIAHSWIDGLSSPSDQQVLLGPTLEPVDFDYPSSNVVPFRLRPAS